MKSRVSAKAFNEKRQSARKFFVGQLPLSVNLAASDLTATQAEIAAVARFLA